MIEVQIPDIADEERQVVSRMAAGERAALAELYATHRSALLAYLRALVDDPGLAEEVLQDTLYAAWVGAGSFAHRSSVRVWLLGIARRRAHDALRRRTIHLVAGEELAGHPAPDPEPESLAIAGVEQDTLRAALMRLRPIHREVLILNFMQELPYRSIAEVLGVPIGTVMSRLHHAKQALRAELDAETWP